MSGQRERRIATVTLVVADYDEAIAWYTDMLGFELGEDVDLGAGKRWVTVSPGSGGTRLLLARADVALSGSGQGQVERVGDQTGGRVAFFLETDDFTRDYTLMRGKGVQFSELPRHESYGTVAVFRDLYGNLWDLIEPKTRA